MKLEIKHLAGYLPYGLKIFSLGETFTLHYYLDSLYVPKDFEHISLENMLKESGNKPILRKLSDLTKEIEVNGEKFIPSEKIAVHLFDFDFLDMVINRKNTNGIPFWVIQKLLEWHFDIYGLIENNLAIDINTLNK